MTRTEDHLVAERVIDAAPADVFALLTDPARHQETEPGRWVREAIEPEQLTRVGQVFSMNMNAEPVGDYVIDNEVIALDPDRTIAWRPGQYDEGGHLGAGGWTWRYDLVPEGSGTRVRVTYDWSATPPHLQEEFGGFPPFDVGFLEQSLDSLASAVTSGR